MAEAVGRRTHIIPCPTFILKNMLVVMRLLNFTDLSPSLFERMNHDLAYDGTEAEQFLNFRPRDFMPEFKD